VRKNSLLKKKELTLTIILRKKSESIKASLTANSNYSGYGSAKAGGKKESNTKTKINRVAKPKFSNTGFSAYSTN
jgi:hypothetical protein